LFWTSCYRERGEATSRRVVLRKVASRRLFQKKFLKIARAPAIQKRQRKKERETERKIASRTVALKKVASVETALLEAAFLEAAFFESLLRGSLAFLEVTVEVTCFVFFYRERW
jgi:hypothetical protein